MVLLLMRTMGPGDSTHAVFGACRCGRRFRGVARVGRRRVALGLQSYLLRFGMTGPEHGTHPSPTFSEGTTGAQTGS